MSLYEVPFKLRFVYNNDYSQNLLCRLMILNFAKINITDKCNLVSDIICSINDKFKTIKFNNDIITKFLQENNIDMFSYDKIIKLHISTLDQYDTMAETIIKNSGFWDASSSKHMFIVNLEEQLKIINSYYYNGFTNNGPQVNKFKRVCQEIDIFSILYNTRKELEDMKYFNSWKNRNIYLLQIVKKTEVLSIVKEGEKLIELHKKMQEKRNERYKMYNYSDSEEIFCDNIVSLCNDMLIMIAKEKQSYGNRKDKELQFMKLDDFKKVGKSTLHLVKGDGFYHKINLCLFDNGDYYFVKMKEQEIICKSDIISKPCMEWCLLIDFIEFHLKMKMSIPSDINLVSQTMRYYEIENKIMTQDKSKEDNHKEFKDIWLNGNLLTYEF